MLDESRLRRSERRFAMSGDLLTLGPVRCILNRSGKYIFSADVQCTNLRSDYRDLLPRVHAMRSATLAVIRSCRLHKAPACSVLPSVSGFLTKRLDCDLR